MKAHRLAQSMFIDHEAGEILIDGETFPWYVAEGGPTVEYELAPDWSIVQLPVLVDHANVAVLHTLKQDLQWIRDEGRRQLDEALLEFRAAHAPAELDASRITTGDPFAGLRSVMRRIARAVKPKPHPWEFTRAR